VPEASQNDIRILIADDDRILAQMLRNVVAAEGRRVDVRNDGQSAIDALRSTAYDLVLADLIMPDIGGIELLRFAKKQDPDVIVIIITGYASLETAISAIKEGAYDYITKPSKLEEIKIAVSNAIETIRLKRANRDLIAKLKEANDAYKELLETREEAEGSERIRFLSAGMTSLHQLYQRPEAKRIDLADKLRALSALKDNGVITEKEFQAFKIQLLLQGRHDF